MYLHSVVLMGDASKDLQKLGMGLCMTMKDSWVLTKKNETNFGACVLAQANWKLNKFEINKFLHNKM